jgi:hypothetical protein
MKVCASLLCVWRFRDFFVLFLVWFVSYVNDIQY